jgi:hypothetical protein
MSQQHCQGVIADVFNEMDNFFRGSSKTTETDTFSKINKKL